MTVTDFTIETAPAPKLTALLGTTRFDLASLDLGAARTTISGRSVTVGPVAAKLTKGAADALNQAFATTAFTEGLISAPPRCPPPPRRPPTVPPAPPHRGRGLPVPRHYVPHATIMRT